MLHLLPFLYVIPILNSHYNKHTKARFPKIRENRDLHHFSPFSPQNRRDEGFTMKVLLNYKGHDRLLGFVIRPERVVLIAGESGIISGGAIGRDGRFGVVFVALP